MCCIPPVAHYHDGTEPHAGLAPCVRAPTPARHYRERNHAMRANQAALSIRTQHTLGKVVSLVTKQGMTPELREQTIAVRESKRYEVCLTRDQLPLTVQYDDTTYVLVLTKSNKLLLQKPIN
jgi:hypothetical protein